MVGDTGKDKKGIYINNQESGFRIRVGEIQDELIYDAAEIGDPFALEDMKRVGPVFGIHLRWRF